MRRRKERERGHWSYILFLWPSTCRMPDRGAQRKMFFRLPFFHLAGQEIAQKKRGGKKALLGLMPRMEKKRNRRSVHLQWTPSKRRDSPGKGKEGRTRPSFRACPGKKKKELRRRAGIIEGKLLRGERGEWAA